MDEISEKDVMKEILSDPNSDQLSRDLAHLHLAEAEAMPSAAEEEEVTDRNIGEKWALVESYELGLVEMSDEDVIQLAVDALKAAGRAQMTLRGRTNAEGKTDVLLAYPKLVRAANTMIQTNHAKRVNAYHILGILSRPTDHSGAVQYFTKAVQMEPKNWLLRSQLASTYIMMEKPALSLQSLLVAIDLCNTEYEKFDLYTRKAQALLTLNRHDEARALFEQVIKDSPKYESIMTPDEKGNITVCRYMLCHLYVLQRDKKNALHQWQLAEAERDTLPPQVVQGPDWRARSCTRWSLANLDPSFLSHQECHNCRKLVKDPKKCSACGVALYCSRECQVTAWKSGHKQECKKAKEDRKEGEKKQKQAAIAVSNSRNLPPLDLALDPRKLWAKADKLARKRTKAQEAVFYYLVAIFMDIRIIAQDKQLAKRALAACDSNDPMAIALKLAISPDPNNVLKSCDEAQEAIMEYLNHDTVDVVGESSVESLEEIDRSRFGVAMVHIFHARILGHCFNGRSYGRSREQAMSGQYKEAFEDIMALVTNAQVYLNSDRWLTYQFELGHCNLDVAATDEAKRWLAMFLDNLESAKRSNGSLNRHWTMFKAKAEEKMSWIPELERATKSGRIL